MQGAASTAPDTQETPVWEMHAAVHQDPALPIDDDVRDSDDARDAEYIDIHIRVPKANATKLLKDMMSEYSEDACCARWGSDIDIEIDADARKRLAPGGNVARHSREMLDVALAQIHRHCGGWWSDRGPRADQQGWSLAFYPLDEWVALPVPYGMRESVAYPDAVIEERPPWWDSPVLDESGDSDWWWSGPGHDAAAGPTGRLDAVPESTAAADTPAPLQPAPGPAL
ncbi:hypothetical protein [Pandoravirus japonicus]|uniref:Uncharacterized protein n=1 Tax=Pandoravirus japonicus TaxID=2823154 RepID=A0A811BRN5_9VIRU|nr:hypothetical protein [Pandoravirus japonicus]